MLTNLRQNFLTALRLLRRAYQKLIIEFLILARSYSNPEFRLYRKIRSLILGGKPKFSDKSLIVPGNKLKFHEKKYILWNNPISGFSHQTSVYVMGFVIARLLNRTVLLNQMLLNLYHNRGYDRMPRLCDPKIFYNWEKLNQAVNVLSLTEIPDLNEIYERSTDHVNYIDLDCNYNSDLLLISNTNNSKQFFREDAIPIGIIDQCDLIVSYMEYSDDIKQRAEMIGKYLNDYDAIHIRRGDMLFKDSRLLNNSLKPDEVAVVTDLSRYIETLKNWIEPGRTLYIATDERDLSFFDELNKYYNIYFAKDFYDILANDQLPLEVRNNSYYILCIEELVLCQARRFVGALPVSTTRKVDKMRMKFSNIDKNIYNLSSNRYLEYAKNRDIWCVSYEELYQRIKRL